MIAVEFSSRDRTWFLILELRPIGFRVCFNYKHALPPMNILGSEI